MKFIGKEEQRRTELRIQSLQTEVSDLQRQLQFAQLSVNIAKQEGSEAIAVIQAQLESTQTQLDAVSTELAATQAASSKAKQDAESALAAAKAQAAEHAQASSQAQEASKAQLDIANKALADARAQLDAKSKELAAVQAAATKARQDAESALAAAKAQAAEHAQASSQAKEAAKAQIDSANKALADARAQLDAKNKEMAAAQAAAQAAAAKAKQEADAALSAAKSAADAGKKAADAATAEKAKALADAQAKLDAQAKELSALKTERDKQAKLAQQTEAKYQDSAQENELLLLQLMQAQEELVEYYEQKGEFEKLYLAYKARWDRLEKRLPNYLDFGAIEIVDVDGVSDVPSITWQVKDFAQAGVALSEFRFVTVLQDGHPGMGLVKDGQPQAFVPKLLGTHKDQLATFLGLGTTEFKQLTAAVSILDQLEAGQWAGFEFPKQFDLGFWRPSIKALTAQLKLLPVLLRYDEVRLKRELINPDYEHLWLEFRGLSMGAAHWKKFEIRLGAALVQADGFSQYPKFEIPLIDGKTKPFDSWYAESQDDSGAKLELRFALDKNVFDVAVWSKLADADKALLLRLIYAMPDALRRLNQQKTAIHRPWATWIDFAAGAVKVLQANKAAAKVATQPALEVPKLANAPQAQPAPEAALAVTPALAAPAAPAKLTSTGAKAGKVISITTKPVPKPKPKTAAKAKPAAPTVQKAKA